MKFCPHCGTARPAESKFCPGCGVSVAAAEPLGAAVLTSMPAAAETVVAPNTKDPIRPWWEERPVADPVSSSEQPTVVPRVPLPIRPLAVGEPPPRVSDRRRRRTVLLGSAAGLAAVVAVAGVALALSSRGGANEATRPVEPQPGRDEPGATSTSPATRMTDTPDSGAPAAGLSPNDAAVLSESDAARRLAERASVDRAAVAALPAGQWVPQLSSKCGGLREADAVGSDGRIGGWDKVAEDYPSGFGSGRVLGFHLGLERRLAGERLLLATPEQVGAPRVAEACRGTSMWISLVASQTQARPDDVLQWCDRNGIPANGCGARQILHGADKTAYVPGVHPDVPAYPGIPLTTGGTPSSADVRLVQQRLTDLGFPTPVDGVYGSPTDAAIRQFQTTHGHSADGIVGPDDWENLFGLEPG